MTTTAAIHQRTGAKTRAEILRVALKLFTEQGFEGTSIRDISSALGITKSALYYHFRNKEEIVTSLTAERRHDLDDFIAWLATQPDAPDLLERAALRWVETTTSRSLAVMGLVHANQPIMRRLVAGGQDIRAGFDPVIDRFVDETTSTVDRLLIRMTFDTASAALLAAQRVPTSPDDVIAAARRATRALAQAVAAGAGNPG